MYLPTYEECVEIVKNNEAFKEKIEYVGDTKVSIFNYLLAGYQDFKKPIENSDIEAFELRGITFVHNPEGIERYLMLHKFFNIDQTIGYMTNEVKDKKVVSIQDKRDGSMIRFIKVNGEIIAKTKMSLKNDQTELAMKEYNNNQNIKDFVKESLEEGLSAIFELTSPFNRIVLQYPKTELKLLQLRDEKTGEYYDIYSHDLVKKHNIGLADSVDVNKIEKIVSYINQTIDFKSTLKNIENVLNITKPKNIEDSIVLLNEAIETFEIDNKIDNDFKIVNLLKILQNHLENSEGFVISTECGQHLKLKTIWYFELHRLLTEDVTREDFIISAVLNETIDDILSQLEKGDEARKKVEGIATDLMHYFNHNVKVITNILKNFDGNKKNLAKQVKYNKYSGIILRSASLKEEEWDIEKKLKDKLLKDTRKLEKAREFVEEIYSNK